jgi:hypothetical protein
VGLRYWKAEGHAEISGGKVVLMAGWGAFILSCRSEYILCRNGVPNSAKQNEMEYAIPFLGIFGAGSL